MEPRAFLLVLAFLITSFLATAIVILGASIRERTRSKIRQRLGTDDEPVDEVAIELEIEPDFAEEPGLIARFEGWFYRLIGETGMTMNAEAAMLMAVGAGLVLCGVLLLWRDDFLAAAIGLAAGITLVVIYFMWRRSQRRVAIQEQLPDVMELLSRAVRAGESLDQAMALVSRTTQAPLGPEFRRCANQLDMGLSVNAAMRSLVRRAPIPEMRILASTLIMQRRTGGNLSLMLDRLSNVIRDRINYHRTFKAATGASRVSTMMIGAAGPLVAIYMLIWQRDYFNKFFETFGGQVMLGSAVALQVVGLIWIYALLRSDY